jgi:hypothetical protein
VYDCKVRRRKLSFDCAAVLEKVMLLFGHHMESEV